MPIGLPCPSHRLHTGRRPRVIDHRVQDPDPRVIDRRQARDPGPRAIGPPLGVLAPLDIDLAIDHRRAIGLRPDSGEVVGAWAGLGSVGCPGAAAVGAAGSGASLESL